MFEEPHSHRPRNVETCIAIARVVAHTDTADAGGRANNAGISLQFIEHAVAVLGMG